mgnify:CR=1 FL=1
METTRGDSGEGEVSKMKLCRCKEKRRLSRGEEGGKELELRDAVDVEQKLAHARGGGGGGGGGGLWRSTDTYSAAEVDWANREPRERKLLGKL